MSFRSENLESSSATRFERCSDIIQRVISVDLQLPRCVNPEKFCLDISAVKYVSLSIQPKILVLQSMNVLFAL